ncbi:MAG: conjugal transfer protein TraB [Desulfobacterales bacterium]|nr:conjugal transfer protein TraB [Desulfobacterales bacterium]
MAYKQEEMVLKTVKEIVVKFIEVGNISPASFHDHFRNIYKTVDAAVKDAERRPASKEEGGGD